MLILKTSLISKCLCSDSIIHPKAHFSNAVLHFTYNILLVFPSPFAHISISYSFWHIFCCIIHHIGSLYLPPSTARAPQQLHLFLLPSSTASWPDQSLSYEQSLLILASSCSYFLVFSSSCFLVISSLFTIFNITHISAFHVASCYRWIFFLLLQASWHGSFSVVMSIFWK